MGVTGIGLRRGAARAPVAAVVALVVGCCAVAVLAASRPHARPAAVSPHLRAAAARPAASGMVAGVPLQRATCGSWRAAPAAERAQAVRALAATVGGASTSGGVGTTLADADATALLDRVCATPSTAGFVLYMLYARAAAFSGVGSV